MTDIHETGVNTTTKPHNSNNTVRFQPNISSIAFYPTDTNNVSMHVILSALGCFCFGILVASTIGLVWYRRKNRRLKACAHLAVNHISAENPKLAVLQNDLTRFFHNKEGTVSQDGESVLNFLVTPFICNSFENTNPNSAREQALRELQKDIDRETRGESDTDGQVFNENPAMNTSDIEWKLPRSDVVVNIPAGALPRLASANNFLKVALGANSLTAARKRDQVQLSPLLILSSPNLVRFHKPITVRIPHRAHLTDDAGWTILVRYSGTTHNNINKLEWANGVLDIPNVIMGTDVTYRYDTDYIHVNTYIPGLFCAVGKGIHKQKPLKLAALAFAYSLPPQTCEPEPGQETGNCGIVIKVFLVDYFNEAIQHLQISEDKAGGVCISQPVRLHMVNENDWDVILASLNSPQWPYRVSDGQQTKVISTDSLYQNFGLGNSVEFQIFSKLPPDGSMEHFQATFLLAQRHRNHSNVKATFLTTQTLLLPRTVGSVGSNVSHESDKSPFVSPVVHRNLLLEELI